MANVQHLVRRPRLSRRSQAPHVWENLWIRERQGALGILGKGDCARLWRMTMRPRSSIASGRIRSDTATEACLRWTRGPPGHGRPGGRRTRPGYAAHSFTLNISAWTRALGRHAAAALSSTRGARGRPHLGQGARVRRAKFRMLQTVPLTAGGQLLQSQRTAQWPDRGSHGGSRHALCAINGPCAGGGYELSLATPGSSLPTTVDHVGSPSPRFPSSPSCPVRSVSRLVDKRKVSPGPRARRLLLHAGEGINGSVPSEWRLSGRGGAAARRSRRRQSPRSAEMAARSDRPAGWPRHRLTSTPRARTIEGNRIGSATDRVVDRAACLAYITVAGPATSPHQPRGDPSA